MAKYTRIAENMIKRFQFLLCDTTGRSNEFSASDNNFTASPIQCLDKAVDGNHEIIILSFNSMNIKERETFMELCAVLKQNSHTSSYPVLVLLDSKHREILEYLDKAGVDFIKYTDQARLDSFSIQAIIDELGPGDHVKHHLEELCPFMNYSRIDSRIEMTLCGAYLNRMVLGGCRLHEICETREHLACEYYINPVTVS
ncbi:Uncharacterized protein dnl_33960 [Desulfonema limicola]|uniref:Uncharacterized protein n=1 Tax=Desulfonema limicola TaxID=45656 RepID=A0A975GH95_9BACT|nr:hypothetical protein [Desulfonema limicola]QTA81072.1 Uncharacterized protein dnl_33960 [Desulfonema limicola]